MEDSDAAGRVPLASLNLIGVAETVSVLITPITAQVCLLEILMSIRSSPPHCSNKRRLIFRSRLVAPMGMTSKRAKDDADVSQAGRRTKSRPWIWSYEPKETGLEEHPQRQIDNRMGRRIHVLRIKPPK